MASCHPLELLACLQKQMAFRNCYCKLLSVSEPCKQARVARLTMNGQEVKVIVEASKDSAHIVTGKVTASGGELVRSSLHHLSKNLPVKSHSQCRHLCDCVATVDHVIAPVFAGLLPLWKVFRSLILRNVLHDVSNVP